jgi:hypothetical protein
VADAERTVRAFRNRRVEGEHLIAVSVD